MALHLVNSSCSIFHMVCYNGCLNVEKGDFGILVAKEDLTEENFATLTPKLHIRGLRKALGVTETLISDLEQEL